MRLHNCLVAGAPHPRLQSLDAGAASRLPQHRLPATLAQTTGLIYCQASCIPRDGAIPLCPPTSLSFPCAPLPGAPIIADRLLAYLFWPHHAPISRESSLCRTGRRVQPASAWRTIIRLQQWPCRRSTVALPALLSRQVTPSNPRTSRRRARSLLSPRVSGCKLVCSMRRDRNHKCQPANRNT